jgi:hypothetical protein
LKRGLRIIKLQFIRKVIVVKTKYILLSTLLLILLTLSMSGQNAHKAKSKIVKKKSDISSLMGKPVYESTVDSLNTKVWIVSQKKSRDLMKTKAGKSMGTMKDINMKTTQETKNAMTAGTHYFIFDVTNITTGKALADSSAKVEVVSPSRIVASVTLQPMMNHFGGGVTLDERGEYLFTINVDVGAGYRTTQFKYKIK